MKSTASRLSINLSKKIEIVLAFIQQQNSFLSHFNFLLLAAHYFAFNSRMKSQGKETVRDSSYKGPAVECHLLKDVVEVPWRATFLLAVPATARWKTPNYCRSWLILFDLFHRRPVLTSFHLQPRRCGSHFRPQKKICWLYRPFFFSDVIFFHLTIDQTTPSFFFSPWPIGRWIILTMADTRERWSAGWRDGRVGIIRHWPLERSWGPTST